MVLATRTGERTLPWMTMIASVAMVAIATVANGDSPAIVELQLTNGRTVRADRLVRAEESQLVVLAGTRQAFVVRTIAWSSIARAQVAGHEVTREELKRLATLVEHELAIPIPKPVEPVSGVRLAQRTPPPIVSGVTADAWLVPSSVHAGEDQLVVRVAGVDAFGHRVPVDGTVEIAFVTAASSPFVRDSGAIGYVPVELGRWTQALSSQSHPTGDGLWRYHLPRAASGGLPYGWVQVRLVVPGFGVFETSIDGVRRRSFSPVRDALRGTGGVRTLP